MSNKKLFSSSTPSKVPAPANTVNKAGGTAYTVSAKQEIAQIAATNCFGSTFYASADNLLKLAKDAIAKINDSEFLAKLAVYSRTKSYMKDMPAFLMVVLAGTDTELFRKVFPYVIDNGKMLRNFVQIARSGAVGRKFNLSAGAVRKAIQHWFDSKSPWAIFKASIGRDPSLRDVLKMCRPKPNTGEKAALFAYINGAEFDEETQTFRTYVNNNGKGKKRLAYVHNFKDLPKFVQEFETFKKKQAASKLFGTKLTNEELKVPDVDFQFLTALDLTEDQWKEIARNAPWMMTRMNLNTFNRHGVFKDKEIVKLVADRLSNKEEVVAARAFPYQLLTAYKYASDVPTEIREALQDAADIATENVPVLDGKVYICVDVSGSMSGVVTGNAGGKPSVVRCIEVAGLYASVLLRKNKSAEVLAFDTATRNCDLNPRDSIFTNAAKLAAINGGGTDCSAPLRTLNSRNAKGDYVIYVSDYESWAGHRTVAPGLAAEWAKFKARNPHAKLICIDLQPRNNTQATENKDTLFVGGFSDQVFNVIGNFAEYNQDKNHWVAQIEKIDLNALGKKEVIEPEESDDE